MKIVWEGCSDCLYIESGARSHTKKKVLPTEGVVSLREGA
jgi:hypothetical protein